MLTMPDPEIIKSRHSGTFTKDGVTVEVCIYRLANTRWTLEVVDCEGTSTAWDDEFETDDAALAEFLSSVAAGMVEYQPAASKRVNRSGRQPFASPRLHQ